MIAQNIAMKIDGRLYEAVRSFALRTGATTTKEAFRTMIKLTPEYQVLQNIRINTNASLPISETTRLLTSCQGKNS